MTNDIKSQEASDRQSRSRDDELCLARRSPKSTTCDADTQSSAISRNRFMANNTEQQEEKCNLSNGLVKPRTIQIRFLVSRREAGALIGKGGSNIKRLRQTHCSSILNIPDTGNGPERIVSIATDKQSLNPILSDLVRSLLAKSSQRDDQIELKMLIHSGHAGSLIGIGGQAIKKLRNVRPITKQKEDTFESHEASITFERRLSSSFISLRNDYSLGQP